MPEETWEVLDRRRLLLTPRGIEVAVETVRLPDGRIVNDYEQLVVGDSAVVFAETWDGCVVVLRFYCHGARRSCIGLPGGRVDPTELPLATAQRELLEETGYSAPDWAPLGSFTRNGNQGGGVDHLFHARGARPVAAPDGGDLERITVMTLGRDELARALRENAIAVSAHALAAALGMLDGEAAPVP